MRLSGAPPLRPEGVRVRPAAPPVGNFPKNPPEKGGPG
jgi:hypothetical protein